MNDEKEPMRKKPDEDPIRLTLNGGELKGELKPLGGSKADECGGRERTNRKDQRGAGNHGSDHRNGFRQRQQENRND